MKKKDKYKIIIGAIIVPLEKDLLLEKGYANKINDLLGSPDKNIIDIGIEFLKAEMKTIRDNVTFLVYIQHYEELCTSLYPNHVTDLLYPFKIKLELYEKEI